MTPQAATAALARVPPFDRLSAAELQQLATVGLLGRWAPGAVVHGGAPAPPRLLVVLSGGLLRPDGSAAGPVAGLAAMFDAAPERLTADPVLGTAALSLDRPTFFTFARECPAIIRGLLECR